MSERPEGWESCSLETVLISLESGSRPRGGVRGIQEGVPSIGGEHLTFAGTFDFSNIKYVPTIFAAKMSQGHIKTNDILIVKDGATTAKTSFITEDFPYNNAVVNEHVFVCRPSELINPRFLFRYLTSKEGQTRILENFQGSAQGGINRSFASNTEIPLAPLNEQRRIVTKLEKLLSRVDAAQERLATIPHILKRFRQSVLSAACSGNLTTDWREQHGLAQHQWKKSALTNLLSEPLSNGRSVVDGEGFPVLRLTCLKNGKIELSERKLGAWTFDTAKKFLVLEGDFFVSRGNGSLSHVGRGGLVEEKPDPVAFPDTLIRLRVRNDLMYPKFLREIWRSSLVRNQIESAAHTTAGIWKISQKDIESFILPVPRLSEQQEIVRRVEGLFKTADALEARYLKAKKHVDKLTQSILAKAFRGELVPQDPTDEPASTLLERIQRVRRDNEATIEKSMR